tara:strand:- start:831 stop:1199 length:369 start_codon:yes stop_codon:yes gene_type:complete
MLIVLSFLYFVYGYFLSFAFKKGSFIKYLYDKKNINVLLSIEITFVILCSIVVFLNQPLNIIVALIMFMHIFGVFWIIANPKTFYEMIEESLIAMDEVYLERISSLMMFSFSFLVLLSLFIF